MKEKIIREMYACMGIEEAVYAYGNEILAKLQPRFQEIDETAEINQLKVIKAMQESQVSEACLLGTTGYGYNDLGRDRLEEVYRKICRYAREHCLELPGYAYEEGLNEMSLQNREDYITMVTVGLQKCRQGGGP